MFHILTEVISLLQYVEQFNDNKLSRLTHCLACGRLNPWFHGYPRQSDRISHSNTSMNPIWIHRYYCPDCYKTCSVLPECIPPRRWYLWEAQQIAILLFLLSGSAQTIIKNYRASCLYYTLFVCENNKTGARHADNFT